MCRDLAWSHGSLVYTLTCPVTIKVLQLWRKLVVSPNISAFLIFKNFIIVHLWVTHLAVVAHFAAIMKKFCGFNEHWCVSNLQQFHYCTFMSNTSCCCGAFCCQVTESRFRWDYSRLWFDLIHWRIHATLGGDKLNYNLFELTGFTPKAARYISFVF